MILLEREKLLSELEQKIGYSFRSRALLDRALTHRSFANERVGENCQHNEAMEFLGDSVLGFVVTAWLLERFPDLSEGKLSKMKAYLVSESRLAELAEALELGGYVLLNRGEEKTGGRRKRALLADAYEALIGVLYVDGGITAAERFLRRELRQKLMSIDPTSMIGADYKSALQEKLQAAGGPGPEYVVVEALGPDHRRTFRVELRIGGRRIAAGEGHTIKLAQQEAARSALDSPDDLAGIAPEHGRTVTDHPLDACGAADGEIPSESFAGEPAPSLRFHGDEEVEDASDASSAPDTQGSIGHIAGRTPEGSRDSEHTEKTFRGDRSLELSADAEGECEARSVTSDV
jgi:ribonuclease-3